MNKIRLVVLFFFMLFTSFTVLAGGDLNWRIKALKQKDLPDSTRITHLKYLYTEFKNWDDDVALEYGKKLLDFAYLKSIELDDKFEIDYGNSLIHFKHYNEGLKYIHSLYKKYKYKENYPYMLKAESLIALLYYKKGYISKSILYYKNNIKLGIELKEYDFVAYTSYTLANVYSDIGETINEFNSLNEAYKYYQKSKTPNNDQILITLHRIGNIFFKKEKYSEALSNFKKGISLAQSINDSTSILLNSINIARTYFSMGHSDTSLIIYQKIIPLCSILKDSSALANSYGHIGIIMFEKGKSQEASKYYSKAIKIANKKKDIYNLAWLYKSLAKISVKEENFKDAYYNHLKYADYQQSLMESDYIKKIGQAKLLYISEKKEKELEMMASKLNENRLLTYGLAIGIVLFVVVGGLIFRQRNQNNIRKLSEMNHKISEVTQKNLRQQMNPHFIFNTLNSIQYYMYQNDRISTNNYLTKFSSLMRKTLENSTHTSIPISDEIEALQLYLQLEALRFKDKFKWEIKIDEEIDTLLFKIPTMLIQPYVENSICHGLSNKDESGFININLKLMDNYISVTIEDDGVGREKALQIKKIKNGNQASLGTKITESRLKLVNALYGNEMKIHYEDLMNDKNEPAGTRVVINIPIIS